MKRGVEEADLGDPVTLHSRPTQSNSFIISENSPKVSNLSDTKIFDRQIRLWGVEVQQKLMNTTVLFAGRSVILEEAAKNCLLTGMNIIFLNCRAVDELDCKHSFFIEQEDIGTPHSISLANRLQAITSDPKRVSGYIGALCTSRFNQINVHLFDKVDDDLDDVDYSKPGTCPFCVLNKPITQLNKLSQSIQTICVASEDYPLHSLIELDHMCRIRFKSLYVTYCNGKSGFFISDPAVQQPLDRQIKEIKAKNKQNSINYPPFESFFIKKTWEFDKKCGQSIKCGAALLLVERFAPKALKPDPSAEDTNSAKKICDKVGADYEEFKKMVKDYRVQFTLTGSIIGGYLSVEIQQFISKQHDTFPNLCLFDMDSNVVTTYMI